MPLSGCKLLGPAPSAGPQSQIAARLLAKFCQFQIAPSSIAGFPKKKSFTTKPPLPVSSTEGILESANATTEPSPSDGDGAAKNLHPRSVVRHTAYP